MYSSGKTHPRKRKTFLWLFLTVLGTVAAAVAIYIILFSNLSIEERIERYVSYDETITENESTSINNYIVFNQIELDSEINVSSSISENITDINKTTDSFVPVVGMYSVQQDITSEQFLSTEIVYDKDVGEGVGNQINDFIGITEVINEKIAIENEELQEGQVAIINSNDLSSTVKLIELNGDYYIDEFESGAFFRTVIISGEESDKFNNLSFDEMLSKENVYKTNITGVTALTRVMINRLNEVGNPSFFSEKIGPFLADADLTHVSNEVSFKPGCTFAESSVLLFCSPPEFIETLKSSGVDLVELTGNHNNDFGSELNKETIELYESLGWGTVGGGLNNEDAAEAFYTNDKGSKLAFLAYNYPDSPNGSAISGVDTAGANSFDFTRIEADILEAKQKADFVTVNVQYWECYAYPDGYIEFPECDKPIGEQEADFKRIVDLGADMVIGSSAHQPQTWEIYKNKPIYYGLGNLYFDQTRWPGTERGLVLSNYFIDGELIQTKITPTVYGDDLQTRLMTEEESTFLLNRLKEAR